MKRLSVLMTALLLSVLVGCAQEEDQKAPDNSSMHLNGQVEPFIQGETEVFRASCLKDNAKDIERGAVTASKCAVDFTTKAKTKSARKGLWKDLAAILYPAYYYYGGGSNYNSVCVAIYGYYWSGCGSTLGSNNWYNNYYSSTNYNSCGNYYWYQYPYYNYYYYYNYTYTYGVPPSCYSTYY